MGRLDSLKASRVSPVVLHPFEPQAMAVLGPNVLLPAPYLAEFRRALAEAPGQEGPQMKQAGGGLEPWADERYGLQEGRVLATGPRWCLW